MRLISNCLRLMSIGLLLVCGLGCAGESSQNLGETDFLVGSASDSLASAPNPLRSASIFTQESASASARHSSALAGGCQAQGIDDEEVFARKICASARDFGFEAELVHSYGAGGVNVFISEADAEHLAHNRMELERSTTALTEWTKRNYTAFNAVEVTIVGASKIAKGSKLGTRPTTLQLYPVN